LQPTSPPKLIEYFIKYPEAVHEVLVKGDRKCVVVLKMTFKLTLTFSKPESYGRCFIQHGFENSTTFYCEITRLEKKMSLSEYGIKKAEALEFDNEEDFYKQIGLPYIPPEIRNGTDEIELRKRNKLPDLVEL